MPKAPVFEKTDKTTVDDSDIMEALELTQDDLDGNNKPAEDPKPEDNQPPQDNKQTQEPPAEDGKPKEEEKKEDDQQVLDLDDTEDIIADLTGETPQDSSEEDNDEELLKNMDEKSASAFKAMRQQINELKEKAGTSVESDVVKSLREENERLNTRIAQADMTKSPQFIRTYDQPIKESFANIQSFIKKVGGNPALASNVAKLNIVARKELLSERLPDFAAEIGLMFHSLDSLVASRARAIQNHKTESLRLKHQETERRSAQVGDVFNSAVDQIRQENFMFTKSREGRMPKWDEGVDSRISKARDIMVAMDSDDSIKASMALRASIADDLVKMYLSEREKRVKLEEQSSSKRKSGLKLGSSSDSAPKSKHDPSQPMDASDVADLLTAGM